MKAIHNKSDLAVNGAAPAFEELLHVGRPNMGDREAFLRYVNDIFDRRWLSNDGPLVQEFEARVAAHLGVKHVVAMCNGTIALEIAIRALGFEGEVIVPSYTFVATAHALTWLGLTPVFADIDPRTHNLDPESVRRAITARTSAILPVHLWGRAAPHAQLQAIADEHGLKLFYDAAHAFGCSLGGRMIGNFGACEVFSFHATKFFNTFEGGAIVTNDDALADRLRLMRNFGFSGFDNVVEEGTNGKMAEVCAAMGLANLRHLDRFVDINRQNHEAYAKGLAGLPGLSLRGFDNAERNNYQYVVLEVGADCPVGRDALLAALHAENVLARRYFWPGCHRMAAYRDKPAYGNLALPHTDAVAERVIVLPTGSGASVEAVAEICEIISDRLRAAS
jgi:dTDP-4-amino-4,6-dideoxygalactose transaminase